MSIDEGAERDYIWRRGVNNDIVYIYRPRDKALPPHDITGKVVSLRIQPDGQDEIVLTDENPGVYVSDGPAGKIHNNVTAAMKNDWSWQNAPYGITLDGKMFLRGTITLKNFYER